MKKTVRFCNACIYSLFIIVALVGCGGGSEAQIDPPPVNAAPVIAITSSLDSVLENTSVTLTATAVDTDGSIASVLWKSSNGMLANTDSLTTVFQAPIYDAANSVVTITLTVSDDDGAESTKTLILNILPDIKVTGTISYDNVEVSSQGYDYAHITQNPVRGASINLIDEEGNIVSSTHTDENGVYEIHAPNAARYSVELVAELGSDQTQPNYISVRDNFTASDKVRNPELTEVYSFTLLPIQTVSASLTNIDFNAALNWDSSSNTYDSGRTAPIFVLLDQAYDMQTFLRNWKSDYEFAPLYIFWNENNVAVNGVWWNGEIKKSHVSGHNPSSLMVASDDEVNIDEYDRTIIAHELGHYVLSNLSRDETLGGEHSLQSAMDERQSFAEGFASYFSWLLTGSEELIDSEGLSNGVTFVANIFDNPIDEFDKGWFYEDVNSDVLKNVTLGNSNFGLNAKGYSFVFNVIAENMKSSDALISIHSFLGNSIKRDPNLQNSLSDFAASKGITSVDEWGQGEIYSVLDYLSINNLEHTYLPLYRDMAVGIPIDVCLNDVVAGSGNRLGVFAYLKLDILDGGDYLVEWSSNEGAPSILSQNHLGPRFLSGGGLDDNAESNLYGSRVINDVPAELNIITVAFYGNEFPGADARAPQVGSGCMTITISKI